jgi:hypothetical protein
MSQVLVISTFTSDFQAKPEFIWEGKVNPAQPARRAECALVEMTDGSGCRVNLELPPYNKEIKAGDTLHVECKNLMTLDSCWKVRNITRYTPGAKK